MKIVHIVWSLKFGGIETMLVNIANAQADFGAMVYVVIINDNWDEKLLAEFHTNVTIIKIHKKVGAGTPWFIVRLNRALYKVNPDVIHVHFSNIIGIVDSRLRKKICSTIHSIPFGTVRRTDGIYKYLPILDIGHSDGNVKDLDKVKVFSISNEVHDRLLEKYGIKSDVVFNGVVAENYDIRSESRPSSQFRIVQIGRLEHETKGQDLLIKAAEILDDDVTIDFIGDGLSREYLERLTNECHVENKVAFLGSKPTSYIEKNLSQYDLLAQPSRREGFGLVVAEAMVAKVPVIVSQGQGAEEVTEGDNYGFVFEYDNYVELAKKIRYIMSNYDMALGKVEAARRHVIDNYDVRKTAEIYLKLYKTI